MSVELFIENMPVFQGQKYPICDVNTFEALANRGAELIENEKGVNTLTVRSSRAYEEFINNGEVVRFFHESWKCKFEETPSDNYKLKLAVLYLLYRACIRSGFKQPVILWRHAPEVTKTGELFMRFSVLDRELIGRTPFTEINNSEAILDNLW